MRLETSFFQLMLNVLMMSTIYLPYSHKSSLSIVVITPRQLNNHLHNGAHDPLIKVAGCRKTVPLRVDLQSK